jgi:hypothetical protein
VGLSIRLPAQVRSLVVPLGWNHRARDVVGAGGSGAPHDHVRFEALSRAIGAGRRSLQAVRALGDGGRADGLRVATGRPDGLRVATRRPRDLDATR